MYPNGLDTVVVNSLRGDQVEHSMTVYSLQDLIFDTCLIHTYLAIYYRISLPVVWIQQDRS